MVPGLHLQLLGELTVSRGGEEVPLPPSKKARAILAYLVLSPRDQRRQRLTQLLWDVADDPRAALRWVLSRLRPVVDEAAHQRIVATRDSVRFDPEGAWIDVLEIRRCVSEGLSRLSLEELVRLESWFRGGLLEGLELPEYFDFQAWLTAEREELRSAHLLVLTEWIARAGNQLEVKLGIQRKLLAIDPLNAGVRAEVIAGLYQLRRREEAAELHRLGLRLFLELGEPCPPELAGALSAARSRASDAPEAGPADGFLPNRPLPASPGGAAVLALGEEAVPLSTRRAPALPLVGRSELVSLLTERIASASRKPVLLLGEPGVGKSRLLAELEAWGQRHGLVVTSGRAQEAELARPYGPWLDALRRMVRQSQSERVVQRLVSGLSGIGAADATRDALFAGVSSLLQSEARSRKVLIILDDLHWCDDASVALLSYVIRTCDREDVRLVLASRDGELIDNTALYRLVLMLRRKRWIHEVPVERLDETSTKKLVELALSQDGPASVAGPPSQGPLSTPEQVIAGAYRKSSGNPLFALEWARGAGATSASLRGVVAERLGRLPPDALSLIRWASVFGNQVSLERLQAPLNRTASELYEALEIAERLAILVPKEDGYAFSHEVLRSVVYAEISPPRRRLMHQKVAHTLHPLIQDDPSLVGELAHHAALGGEAHLAAEACVTSGRRCLSLFAGRQADVIARMGLSHAKDLREELRVPLTIELLEVSFRARRPEDSSDVEAELLALARRALDLEQVRHARLAFRALSYLRWEGGNWEGAAKATKELAQISYEGAGAERVESMAEAARCLAVLERDLEEADVLLLEAAELATRFGVASAPLSDAQGLLCQHRGKYDEARVFFAEAARIAQESGEKTLEFSARSNLVLLHIQLGDLACMARQLEPLERLAEKLREGSERPFVAALRAFWSYAGGQAGAEHGSPHLLAEEGRTTSGDARIQRRSELLSQLEALRVVDAKYRLVSLLGRLAALDLASGDLDWAEAEALEAFDVAAALERPSDQAQAHLLLAQVRLAQGDLAGAQGHLLLAQPLASRASAEVRELLEVVRRACEPTRGRRTRSAG